MTSTSEKLLQVVDYKLLPRRRLQQLCKKHGIPANKTNLFMAEALSGLAVLQSSSMLSKTSMDSSMQSPLVTTWTGNNNCGTTTEPNSVTSVSFNPSGQRKRGRPRKQRPIEFDDQDLNLLKVSSKCETLEFSDPANLENQTVVVSQAEKVDASSRNQQSLEEAPTEVLRTLSPNFVYLQGKGVLDCDHSHSDVEALLQKTTVQLGCFPDVNKESTSRTPVLLDAVPCEGEERVDSDTLQAALHKSRVQSEFEEISTKNYSTGNFDVEKSSRRDKTDAPEGEVHVNSEADLYTSGIDKKFEENPTADKLDNESSRGFELRVTAPSDIVVADKEMVDVDGTTETGDASLKVEEPFTCVLPPSAVEDDPVNQRMIVSCTDEQQTYVTQPASKMVDVLVEVSQQEDPSSRTEYGMEIRRDDSRVESVRNPCPQRMQLPDSFVAPDDSSIVSMQVNCQASPKPYYIDSSMQSPEVTIDTVVGELNSVNKVASLSSNHSEQNVGAMPLKQHSIALDQDLVAEVSGKGDVIFSNLVHAGNQYSVLDAEMVEANSCGDVSNISDPGESRHQQYLSSEPQMEVHFTDLEQAKVVVPESDQPLSDMEVVVLNKNIVQDEFEETSNAAGSADKHKESPILSGISEVVPSATTKSKEIVVDPETALCDCAVQNEFQNSPTTIEDNESSKRCWLLEAVPCEFATGDCKMDPDGITETPSITLKRDSSLKVEELCIYPSPFTAEEPSLRERIAAGSTEEPTCSTRIQSGASNFQNEEGDVDMLEDTDWNVHVHVETENKGISIMERSAGKGNESSRGSGILETVPCVVVENEVVGIKPAFCKSSVQKKFEDSPTADKDNERSKELELPEEVHDGVVIIEGKVHLDDISETPHVNLKINVAACKDESMCPALGLSDSPSLQNAEGDVNMIEEAGKELDTGVEPVVYSVFQNELEGTSKRCSAKKDKEKSCGSDILETVSCAMLVREVEEDAAVKAPLRKSSFQNELENYSTAGNKDSERVELLGTNPEIVFSKWMVDPDRRAEQLYGTLQRDSSLQVEEASGEASVKQRTKACCTDQPMDPRMAQSDASSLRIAEGDVDMLEESDAESLYRNANQGRFHQQVGGWVDVELQVSLEHANSYQTDELLFHSVERNVNFSQETNSGFPIRKIDYEGCGDQVEPSIVIASKDAHIGGEEEESERRATEEGLIKTLTTEYDQERLQRRTKPPSSYVDQFKKSPFVRLSRLSSNDLAKVMSAGSVKRAKILAEKRATTQQHLPLLKKTYTSLEPVLPGQLKSDHLHKADALVQSVEGKETDSEITIRKMSDVACADEVQTSTAIGPKDPCMAEQEQELERSATEGLIKKLTTEYAQERLQRRNKLVSSYLDQFKKSPFVKLSRLSSNDVAKVMSAGSIKRAQILAEKRATPQHLPVLDKTHSTTSGSVIFHEEEDSGYVSSSPTETTRSMEDITQKI
ncbi:unnamed protein product [Sphagnum troendelagicum]|uniref:Uncharacterized protein n=1 Tax=Sphagnum troendelagicum TaxID=128251 RepID=A0ABP0UH71_9BRYO